MKNESGNTRIEMVIALAMVFVAIVTRFIPHAPNFSPTLAITLFTGALFTDRRIAYGAPFVVILLSDWALGFYPGLLFVYVAYAASVGLGSYVKSRKAWQVGLAATISSVVFFGLSNLGVWLQGGLYERTWAGLQQCFLMAIPFFQSTLISTLVGSAVLFGCYELAYRRFAAAAERA